MLVRIVRPEVLAYVLAASAQLSMLWSHAEDVGVGI